MNSTVTLAFVVMICAVVVLFSNEFGNVIKKILSFWGMKALLPLLVTTTVIVSFESGFYLILTKMRTILMTITEAISTVLPFASGGAMAAKILVLVCFSFLPVLAIHFWFKRKSYLFFQHAYFTNTVLWLFLGVLLTISE